VVVVNGGDEILEMLSTVLDAGQYEVTLVDATTHAYSHIRMAQPHLVILCIRVDDAEGLKVLSMLKLDVDTRAIPVLTFTVEDSKARDGSLGPETLRAQHAPKPASQMN
jgi:DNA-binding response OmpR family regulator